jgi:hypothetical protein
VDGSNIQTCRYCTDCGFLDNLTEGIEELFDLVIEIDDDKKSYAGK